MARAAVIVSLMVMAVIACGCASPQRAPVDTSRTRVVLLPDEEGQVGTVLVTTPHGSQKVDRAYTFTTVAGAGAQPSPLQLMGEERANAEFTDLMRSQPLKPMAFTLYFVFDSTTLTAESLALLPTLFQAVHDRRPTEVSIFGHTDATGSEDRNIQLSAERAKAVERILRKRDPGLGRIEVQFFGSQEPLIPTPPRTAEPRNRRAEVMIL